MTPTPFDLDRTEPPDDPTAHCLDLTPPPASTLPDTDNRPRPIIMTQHTPPTATPNLYLSPVEPRRAKAKRSCHAVASNVRPRDNTARRVPRLHIPYTARPSELRSDRCGATLRSVITRRLTSLRSPRARDDGLT
jgi:hypothetical protein